MRDDEAAGRGSAEEVHDREEEARGREASAEAREAERHREDEGAGADQPGDADEGAAVPPEEDERRTGVMRPPTE